MEHYDITDKKKQHIFIILPLSHKNQELCVFLSNNYTRLSKNWTDGVLSR